jgi:hypothetical protein
VEPVTPSPPSVACDPPPLRESDAPSSDDFPVLTDTQKKASETSSDYTPVQNKPEHPILSSPSDEHIVPVPSGLSCVPEPVMETVFDVDANSEQPRHIRCASSAHGSSVTPQQPPFQSPSGSSQVFFPNFLV